MKKLFTLFIFLCAALSSSADELRTVYLKPGSSWVQDNARFALYMFDSKNENNNSWFSFISISNGLYYAYFNVTKYDKMILCRMNPSNSDNNWGNKWNQSANLDKPSVSEPVYTIGGENDWDGGTGTTSSIESESSDRIHKIYIQKKDSEVEDAPCFYEYDNTWNEIDASWPGTAMTTETVNNEEWYVYKTLKTSVIGRVMVPWQSTPESNLESGIITFNLSSADAFYNYYPEAYQIVKTSEALELPSITYFRSDNGTSELKHNFWNNDGLNDKGFTTTTIGGYDWLTVKSYKPTYSIQFYTSDNGNTTYTDGLNRVCTSGETSYYFCRLSWHGNSKLDSGYYLKSTDDAGGGTHFLVSTQMEDLGNFLYKATLDNVTTTRDHYFEIAPLSCLKADDHTIEDYSNLIYSDWWDNNGNKQPCSISGFSKQDQPTMIGKDNGYNRWKISEAYKYDIYYNAATAQVTVVPYFERTLPAEAEGYATFSSDKDVAIPAGITAKYPSEVSSTGAITWTQFENGIRAGQGALLQGTLEGNADTPYKFFAPAERPAAVSGDGNITMEAINATVAETPLQQTDGDFTNYILWKSSNVLGFFKVNSSGTWVNAGTAYLKVKLPSEDSSEAEGAEGAPAFFPLTGETTAIDNLTTEPAAKGEEKIYSLDGRRIVGQPTAKGIYIVNGKKLLKK